MSWLKKVVKKVRRSVKRMSKGKFHIGHQIRTTLPKGLQKKFNRFRWSKFVKRKLGFANGNNSAATISFGGDAPTNGYVYNGKSISDMM